MQGVWGNRSTYDVVVVGGGWAGLTLARQLKREKNDINILVLESETHFKPKVGEATVELTGHYFVKKLGLVNYLYRNHLPKNGLRFLYDSESHDLPLHEMSEHGTTAIPPHPAFQIDRAIFERDLVQMNIDDGVDLLLGAKVTQVDLKNAEHRISFVHEDVAHQVIARWVIDASGRRRFITRKQKWHHEYDVPKHSSSWGRFSHIKDIDSMGTQEWRNKAFGRFLSTIHFSGDGYWIWFIPLSGGHTSVGIVGDKKIVKSFPRKPEQFIEFLNRHAAIKSLLESAQLEDFESWGQLAYRSEQFVTTERWGATGFAAFFLDPLYSGGGDVIAVMNDLLVDLIVEDLGADSLAYGQNFLNEKVPVANGIAREFYQLLYAHVRNTYPILDCAELCSPVIAYNTAAYFLEAAWDYMAGFYSDYDYWLKKSFLRKGYLSLEKILQQQILETVSVLKKQNRYFEKNGEGFFDSGSELYKYFVFQMGEKGKDGWRIDLRIKLWTQIFLKVTETKLNLPGFASRRVVHENITLPFILETPLLGEEHLTSILIRLGEFISNELMNESDLKVGVKVALSSFKSNQVAVYAVDDPIDDDDLSRLEKKANAIWNATQEYVAMPFLVPVFLKYCRGLPDDLMTLPIDLSNLADAESHSATRALADVE